MKTKINIPILFIAFIVVVSSSCDKIDKPFKEEIAPVDTASTDTVVKDSTKYIRKVLVEDYTGHTCGNCPDAAQSLDTILDRNKDKVIAVAIHAGFFAKVNATGYYTYDFSNVNGNELDAFFGISNAGNPNGMVNRIEYPNSIKAYTAWSSIVASELAKEAEVNIKLDVTYNANTRVVSVKTTSKFLLEKTGAYKLCLLVTEDSLIHPQKDYKLPSPSHVLDYKHKHAMRTAINGTFGEEIASGTVAKDFVVEKKHTITLKSDWLDKKCSVVAYVYDAANYYVIQAEEAHVIH